MIDHLSVSMIQQFESCPYCWIEKYVNHRKLPPYQPFIDGKRYHEAVDNYHKGKEFDAEFIKEYTETYLPDYRKQSEIKFKQTLAYDTWRSRLPFTGIIDGIRNDELVDLKYAQSKPSTKQNLQSITYSLVFYMKKGYFPLFTFNWVNKKNKKVKNVSVTHDENDMVWFTKRIDNFIEDISQPIHIIKQLPSRPFMSVHFPDCPHAK